MMKDKITHLKNRFFLKNKKLFMSTFIAANIALLYIIISSVTVITDNKIIDYSFLHPMGREFGYKDVVKIHTGVYGKQLYLPLTHSKGDFFYRIELHNGTKIDLAEVGGVINDEHPYFIIKKIDSQLVSKGICKESSSINFKYITEHLDEVYTEQIRSILQN